MQGPLSTGVIGAIFLIFAINAFPSYVLGFGLLVLFIGLIVFLSLPSCTACGSKRIGYRHQRVDGGPDRRYSSNPKVCRSCGEVQRRPEA